MLEAQTGVMSQVPIQKDWEVREIVEVVQLNVMQIASFLNRFDNSVRSKLSTLNEKLTRLERALELCEAAVKVAKADPAVTKDYDGEEEEEEVEEEEGEEGKAS